MARVKLTPEQWEYVALYDTRERKPISVAKNINLFTLCVSLGIRSKGAYFIRAGRSPLGIHRDSSKPWGYLCGQRDVPPKPRISGRVSTVERHLWPRYTVVCSSSQDLAALARKYGFRPSGSRITPDGVIYGLRSTAK